MSVFFTPHNTHAESSPVKFTGSAPTTQSTISSETFTPRSTQTPQAVTDIIQSIQAPVKFTNPGPVMQSTLTPSTVTKPAPPLPPSIQGQLGVSVPATQPTGPLTPEQIKSAVEFVTPPPTQTSLTQQKGYKALAGIDGLTKDSEQSNILSILDFIFVWGIRVAVLLAVFMIIFGGIQYMTSDAVFNKEEGIHKINAAIIGLMLALSAFLILETINPRIVEEPDSELLNATPAAKK